MAPANYYVDPTGGNDTTGDGTIGTPWKTTQKALSTVTRDATNGDQINVKSGGTDTLSAKLDFTTYGTPTITAPLIIRGYTTAANDGGMGVLSGNNSVACITEAALDFLHLIDMRFTNTGSTDVIRVDADCLIWRCEIDTSARHGLYVGARCVVAECNIHDVATYASGARYGVYASGANGRIIGNRFYITSGYATGGAIDAVAGTECRNNIIRLGGTIGTGIYVPSDGSTIDTNSIYASAGTGVGISIVSGADSNVVANNVVEGFSGTGGVGINIAGAALMYHSNALYNNATNESITGIVTVNSNNDVLAGSAFVNAGSDDFDINGTVAGVTEDGWPSAFLGASSTTPKPDKGASQSGAGAGGGSTVIVIED